MTAKNANWMLFGIDTRDIAQRWVSSWKEFIWGDDSPLRGRLDDSIKVISGDVAQTHHCGRPASGEADLQAIVIPESLVLERKLVLPAMDLVDFKTILVNEVIASSPFSQEDTSWGWSKELSQEGQFVTRIVMAATSSIKEYLNSSHNILNHAGVEVWAQTEGRWVVFQGFGESVRKARYTQRLIRSSAILSFLLAAILMLFGLDATFSNLRLDQLRDEEKIVKENATNAMALRKRLGNTNKSIEEINKLSLEYPNPRFQLALLTQLVGDDAFLQQFQITGNKIRLRGRSRDAAKLMKTLSDEETYLSVSAPQAITRLGNSGMEQFYIDIEVAQDLRR